jgi:hypothetical protein
MRPFVFAVHLRVNPLILYPLLQTTYLPASSCLHTADSGTHCFPHLTFQRFAYNPLLGVCTPFAYAGCDGNANNFQSSDACARACRQHSNEDDCNSHNSCFHRLFAVKEFCRFVHKSILPNSHLLCACSVSLRCRSVRPVGRSANVHHLGLIAVPFRVRMHTHGCCWRRSLLSDTMSVVFSHYFFHNLFSFFSHFNNIFTLCLFVCVFSGCAVNEIETINHSQQLLSASSCSGGFNPGLSSCGFGQPSTRYYYNDQQGRQETHSLPGTPLQTGQCMTFSYSGCGGNGNNFLSSSACQQACSGGGGGGGGGSGVGLCQDGSQPIQSSCKFNSKPDGLPSQQNMLFSRRSVHGESAEHVHRRLRVHSLLGRRTRLLSFIVRVVVLSERFATLDQPSHRSVSHMCGRKRLSDGLHLLGVVKCGRCRRLLLGGGRFGNRNVWRRRTALRPNWCAHSSVVSTRCGTGWIQSMSCRIFVCSGNRGGVRDEMNYTFFIQSTTAQYVCCPGSATSSAQQCQSGQTPYYPPGNLQPQQCQTISPNCPSGYA